VKKHTWLDQPRPGADNGNIAQKDPT